MQNITLSVQTINAVMAYLGTKPFQEVFQIIEAVQKEVNAQQPAPATTEASPVQ
jgi:hypothetical protein